MQIYSMNSKNFTVTLTGIKSYIKSMAAISMLQMIPKVENEPAFCPVFASYRANPI